MYEKTSVTKHVIYGSKSGLFESLVKRHYSCRDYALQITGSFQNICDGIRVHLKWTALSESGIVILALFWDVNRNHFRNAGCLYYFVHFRASKEVFWADHTVCLKSPQRRFQDFPEGGAPTPEGWGRKPIILTSCSRKLHTIEKKIGPGERGGKDRRP